MFGMFFKLGWRNLFRNKRRSFIAGTAIGIGLASLIFVDAVIIGMEDNMVESATSSFMGEAQIQQDKFWKMQEAGDTINKPEEVIAGLKNEKILSHFSPRVLSFGMLTSASDLSPVSVVGVEPEKEKYLSCVSNSIFEGAFIGSGSGRDRDMIIGDKLSEILDAGLNDRLILTVDQSKTGELVQEMFRVSGIFHTGIKEMDGGMVYVHIEKAQKMLGIGGNIHQIAVRFNSLKSSENGSLPFWKKYSRYGNTAKSWGQILPELSAALRLSQFSTLLTGLILFGVVALGIINTLFMSLYERFFEFGVLKAVGTRPGRIAQLIIYEASALAVLSIIIGIMLGFILTYITTLIGINYTGIEFAGVTFQKKIYPVLTLKQFMFYPAWVFVLTLMVSLYPAFYASRLTPANAIRKSL